MKRSIKRKLYYSYHTRIWSVSTTKSLTIAVAYGVTAASMAFINKAVLNTYSYDYPLFLVTAQMTFTIVVLEILRVGGVIRLDPFTLERGKDLLMPSLLYAVNSVLGLVALSDMNIPMFGMMKRCAPIVVLALGAVVLGKGLPSFQVSFSVIILTLGCLIAGYGDLAFDLKTYVYGLTSVLFQGLYLVLVQYSAQSLTALDTLHINSLNTTPLLLLASLLSGEIYDALSSFNYASPAFLGVFSLVISMGCVLNYLLILCTMYNSALTTSITSTLKSIIQTVVGMFTFGGIDLNMYTLSGIGLNLSGGVLYTLAKYLENEKSKHKTPKSPVIQHRS